jgi:cell wall assembly regulator SMI1
MIQPVCWHEQWIPLLADAGCDFLCVDLAPAQDGQRGQIIHFQHDDPCRYVVAPSSRDFLSTFADDLEARKYDIDEESGRLIQLYD